ncbi:MAG: hypothetical protein ACRD1P_00085, partial [Thermoanaerobaculia bacterium]
MRLLCGLALGLLLGGMALGQEASGGPPAPSPMTPVLSISPDIFKDNATTSGLLCITNVNAATAQLQPGDAFEANFEQGSDTVSLSSTVLLVNSSTLQASDFTVSLDSGTQQILVTYVGAAQAFPPGDSVCAQISLNIGSTLGSRTIVFQ